VDIEFTDKGARFDPSQRFRYALWRTWANKGARYVNFVMLNPSTADAEVLDPTVTRCVKYSHQWGYDGVHVTNIFALRSTDPRELYAVTDPVGPSNDQFILETADRAALVVVAWGTHGRFRDRGMEIAELLVPFKPKHFGLTRQGQPRHPLDLRSDADLIDFKIGLARELSGVRGP
jgi:hypothetical protein